MKVKFKSLMMFFVVCLLISCSKNNNDLNIESNDIITDEVETESDNYNLSEGMKMPSIKVETNKGTIFDLSNIDKPVFINFWTTWCPPCREELPFIQNLYEEYAEKMDFILIDLNETKATVQDFLIENEIFTFPIGYDIDGVYGDKFNIISIPTTFIIDKDKIIKHYVIGMRTEEQYRKYINDVLS